MRLRAGPVSFGWIGALLFLAVLPEIAMLWLLIAALIAVVAVAMAVARHIKTRTTNAPNPKEGP